MIENWKKSADKGKTFAALLTELSKTFDHLLYDLIIAKPNANGFSFSAARLIQSYLSNIKQRTKINNVYGSWEEIKQYYHYQTAIKKLNLMKDNGTSFES